MQFTHVFIVCTGNVCHSPVAAALIKACLPRCNVESTRLSALVGQGVEPTARTLAEAAGLDV